MSKILYTDLMEYSTSELAQASWITDAGGGLPSAEYSSDAYTVLLLHCNGVDESTTFTDDANSLTRSNADIDDEDMADISDWADLDSANSTSSQVSFDNKSCMKLDSGTGTYAYRKQDIGSIGTYAVVSFNAYFEALGTKADDDHFIFGAEMTSLKLLVIFGSDGLRVYNGSSYVLIDADIIVQDEWHEWTFVMRHSNDTVDIYLDGVLRYANVDCSYTTTGTDGEIEFVQYGATTNNRITYIDWFKAGSTTTSYGHTVTAVANAQIDTAQKKFGTGSGLFDGSYDHLDCGISDDYRFGSGDFTIDCWVRWASVADNKGICGTWDDGYAFLFITGYVRFYWKESTVTKNMTSAFLPSVDTWYHIALVRNGADLKIYVDGTQSGNTYDISTNSLDDGTKALAVGDYQVTGSITSLNGWIDEFRISKGIARWTANFNVPNLQCYSEDTIKEQGSYSLKIESNTDSINDTLTKTLTDYLDYSVMDVIKFSVRASRTGSNIKLKIHDTGGTTSEHTINIASADTWQTEIFDISAITTTNRDTIDKIIIEIINADVANTIYIDNLFSKAIVESSHVWVG